ncbi:MAG: efflux RND transporter permease subunit [Steroidobacteraceae bacterium]
MNFVTWAIRNPVPVIMLFIGLTLAGLLAFPRLMVQAQPDIEFPGVVITVAYPGVPPSQLETEVTRKVEDAISNLQGINHINSTINNGASTTFVEFTFERDMDQATDDLRDAITRIRSTLPIDANEPIITRTNTAGDPVITFGVSSDNLSDTELSWFVDLTVMREITAVKGVGAVNRVGGVAREIAVELDPDGMASMNVTAGDVSRQLLRTQVELPGGEGRVGGQEQNVRTTGTVSSAQELAALPIPLADGRNVRLDSIATIKDQAAEVRQLALLDGKRVIGFQVIRSWGAGALEVAEGTREAVRKLQERNPQVKIAEINSTVEYIRESFVSSMEMLLEGALLAIAVVWLFLRDMRATLISAITLPLAIIPTFAAMYLLGYTLNILTLLALSLVVGMLVDDAIVEVENIHRHLRMGKKPLQAATDAAIEIGLAVVATTLTLVAVFVPVAFMSGMPGKFFRPFAFTAAVAVIFSLLVARLLTPMMAAYTMKANEETESIGKFKARYLAWVNTALAHRRITLGIATILMVASISLAAVLPTGFAPAGDVGFVLLNAELPPGAQLQDTRAASEQIRERLVGMKEVEHVYTVIGSGGNVRSARITIMLSPAGDRDISQQDFQRTLMPKLRDVPGVRLSFGGGGGGPGGGKLSIQLTGEDSVALAMAATSLERDMRTLPNAGSVTTTASLLQPEIVVRPLPERAAELGVSTDTISTVTRIATSGDVSNNLAKLNLPDRQVPIRVRLNPEARGNLDRIKQLNVPGRNGPVPLMNVADVSFGAGPVQITRYDRSRNISVSMDLNGASLGPMLALARNLPTMKNLPPGVRPLDSGEAEFIKELFSGFAIAMIVGIFCIYALLVLLFHDFLQPITILSALPPSAGGAILCLWIFNFELSIPSLIGLLMLMGIVTKNSILLVEYAVMARREHGLNRKEALLDACSKRARPIIMTTIAMGAGMLPVALGLSGDSSFRSPMGVAVIGGLIASTGLSLFVVPVIYTLVDDFEHWVKRRFRRGGKHEAVGMPAAELPSEPAPS